MAEKTPVLGIDFGTTNCCVAVLQKGQVEIISNEIGNRTTPSLVAFTRVGKVVGEEAKRHLISNPTNCIFNVKRLLARRFDGRVQKMTRRWPFIVNNDGRPQIVSGDHNRLHAEEVSANILYKLRRFSEAHLGRKIRNAVVTVPDSFSDSQRQAVIDACSIARLNVLRLVNDTSAVAITYGAVRRPFGICNVLVFSMGSGFFNVSVVTINGGAFQVRATTGDSFLSGEEFDDRLVRHFSHKIYRTHQKVLTEEALMKLRIACEKAKRDLSCSSKTVIQIDSLHTGFDFKSNISRNEFEKLCSDLFQRAMKLVENAIEMAGIANRAINDIVVVGGSSRIPKIQELLKESFHGKNLCFSVNPDEGMAYGAAVQAAFLNGEESVSGVAFWISEVVSRSLGIEFLSGFMNTLIKRNTKIPCRRVFMVTTPYDNCTSLSYKLFQDFLPINCEYQGDLILTGIPKAPKGNLAIHITFLINSNGCLNVTAKAKYKHEVHEVLISKKFLNLDKVEIARLSIKLMRHNFEEIQRLQSRDRLKRYAESVKQSITSACDDALKWLEDNSLSETAETERRLLRLQQMSSTFIDRNNIP